MVSPFLQFLKGDLFPAATKELSLSTAVVRDKIGHALIYQEASVNIATNKAVF